MKPIRTLILHPALAPYRVDLFNALHRRLELRLLFLERNVDVQAYDQRRLRAALEADHAYLESGGPLYRRLPRGLGAALRAFRPEVVISHEFSPLTQWCSLRRRLGADFAHLAWTADNPMVIAAERRARSLARRWVLPHLDGLIVYADETHALYRHDFGFGAPIAVTPNNQSPESLREALRASLPQARMLAETHGLTGRRIVLYVGRLAAVKRVDRLIDAFAASQHRNASLVVVGDGPERAALQARAAARGIAERTLFTGHLEGPALHAWFACGGLFVLPSALETWGAVVDEALHAGMPVICSEQAGARVLIADGINGARCEMADAAALRRTLDAWLARIAPFGMEHLRAPRRSLQRVDFTQGVDSFVTTVETCAARRGR